MNKKLMKCINIFLIVILLVGSFGFGGESVEAKKRGRNFGITKTFNYKKKPKVTKAAYRPAKKVGRKYTPPKKAPKVKFYRPKPKPKAKPRYKATPPKKKAPSRGRSHGQNARRQIHRPAKKHKKQNKAKPKAKQQHKAKSKAKSKARPKAKAKPKQQKKKNGLIKKAQNFGKKAKQNIKKSKIVKGAQRGFKAGKKIAKSKTTKKVLGAVGDFIGYNDIHILVTGKDPVTGKKSSRLKAAAWTAVNFTPVGKVGKLGKVAFKGAKATKVYRRGAKVAKASKTLKKAKPYVRSGVKHGRKVASKVGRGVNKARNTKVVRGLNKAIKKTTQPYRNIKNKAKNKAKKWVNKALKPAKKKGGKAHKAKPQTKKGSVNKGRQAGEKDAGIKNSKEYTYSHSVIEKSKTDPLYHNFPKQLDKDILSNPVVTRLDGRTEYVAKGFINDTEGVYHITVKDNRIIHRVFIPKKRWISFSKEKNLPAFDQISKVKGGN